MKDSVREPSLRVGGGSPVLSTLPRLRRLAYAADVIGRTLREHPALSALYATRDALRSLPRRARNADWRESILAELALLPRGAQGVLPWLLRTRLGTVKTLLDVTLMHATEAPDEFAFLMDDERMSWRDLAERTAQVAHVLREEGVRRGDVVALLGQNSPTYLALLFGITRAGATAALINNHLEGAPLAHALKSSGARVLLLERSCQDGVEAEQLVTLTYLGGDLDARLDAAPRHGVTPIPPAEDADFVYIYTSGTTGLPKPCRVSHGKAIMAGAGFGSVMFRFEPGDVLYCVLPLYHSNALLLGLGSAVVTRTPMALRQTFSAHAFWQDALRYQATAMLYIGELCRYLLATETCPEERLHRIRVAVGNGMRPDVWTPFSERFGIPEIREFYGATEAPGILLNLSGKPGAVGHLPLGGRPLFELAKYDADAGELWRDQDGFCVHAAPEEPGELLVRIGDKPITPLTEFRGYTDEEATRKKQLVSVFREGDQFYRTGDLLRTDGEGFFYFVDRIGDTYRWKGENVSTAEVADVLADAEGVAQVTVIGIRVPGLEGRCGLAAVLPADTLDLAAFAARAEQLPSYARPRFVRVLGAMDTTATFKVQKSRLEQEGADPSKVNDDLFVLTPEGYQALTIARWRDVLSGELRL